MKSETGQVSLAEICSDVSYGYTESASSEPVGPKFLRITDIQGGTFDWEKVPFCPASDENVKKYQLMVGDIVVARTGNSTGENAQVTELPPPAVFASYLIRFRPDSSRVNPFFVGYQLRSDRFRQHVLAVRGGSAQPGANAKQLGAFPVQLIARELQDSTVVILRSLDNRIALLRETNATLEAIAQAIFKSWFVDFDPVHAKAEGRVPEGMDEATAALFPDGFEESELGLIPRGWEIRKAETLLTRLSTKVRYSKEQVDSSGATPVYEQGVGVLLGYHDNSAQFPATPNDPLFIFGDHTCVTHLSCEPFDVSMNVIPLKGSDRSTLWTYYAIKDKQTFQEYRRHWMELTIKEIVVAPREICDQFSLIASALHVKMESNTWQANILSNLRDTLLPRLISGKLRLPEAEAIMGEIS